MAAVTDVIRDATNHTPHVQDCRRLGRYDHSRSVSHPRPVLVKLGSTFEVDLVLANSRSIDRPLLVRRDLSPTDRVIRSVLLKERWKLIQSGTNREDIRIKDGSLFVNGARFGSVENSSFIRVDSELTASSSNATGSITTDPPSSNPNGRVTNSPPAGDDEPMVDAGSSS